MLLTLSLLLLSFGGPGTQSKSTYILELHGAAVGFVELELADNLFTYKSRHLFRHEQRAESAQFALNKTTQKTKLGEWPEALWFWRKPKLACDAGVDELTGKKGVLCADTKNGNLVRGIAFGQKFEAFYDADDVLDTLVLADSKFKRSRGEHVPLERDVFSKGFSLTGAGRRLAIAPKLPGSFSLLNAPKPFASTKVENGACLERALALIQASPEEYELVLGLVEHRDRAWPHAWVREKHSGAQLDPSVADEASSFAAYLELPKDKAGQLFLDLLAGRRKVIRSWR